MAKETGKVGRATRVWIAALNVRDMDREVRFYRDVLGFPVALDARPSFPWVELGPKEPLCKIGLNGVGERTPPKGRVRPSGIVLDTDDMDALAARLKKARVRFTRQPTRAPWGGVVADFVDPEGNEIEVVFDPSHYDASTKPPV